MYEITFGTTRSYTDLGLILADVAITPPEPQRFLVEVPGRNGTLDLTDAVTPRMTYKDRLIQFTFNTIGSCNYQQKLTQVNNAIHGQHLAVTFSSDSLYYWDAFVTVSSQGSSESLGTFQVDCVCYPYKLKAAQTVVTQSGSGTVTLTNGALPVVPVIDTSASATLVFNGITETVSAGTHILVDFVLEQGTNNITVTSTGTTKFTYREGEL